jgi:hypothetical protein
MKKIWPILTIFLVLFAVSTPRAVEAGPLLKFSPTSGSYANGSNFTVILGIDSGTQKVFGADAWVTFDATKLEVVSIEKAANPAFSFSLGKNIYNTTGKFDVNLSASGIDIPEATVASGELAVITFKAKSTGTASVTFNCVAGSLIDTNIFNTEAADVIDCASNQNASYTITASGSSTTNPTSTPVPTNGAVSTTTQTSSELPRTGGVETTIGLVIFGLVGILAGSLLKWL